MTADQCWFVFLYFPIIHSSNVYWKLWLQTMMISMGIPIGYPIEIVFWLRIRRCNVQLISNWLLAKLLICAFSKVFAILLFYWYPASMNWGGARSVYIILLPPPETWKGHHETFLNRIFFHKPRLYGCRYRLLFYQYFAKKERPQNFIRFAKGCR